MIWCFYYLFHFSKYDGKTEVPAIDLNNKEIKDCILSTRDDFFFKICKILFISFFIFYIMKTKKVKYFVQNFMPDQRYTVM